MSFLTRYHNRTVDIIKPNSQNPAVTFANYTDLIKLYIHLECRISIFCSAPNWRSQYIFRPKKEVVMLPSVTDPKMWKIGMAFFIFLFFE